MSRSSKKGPFVDQKLLKKVAKLGSAGGPISGGKPIVIKTWSRDSEIAPEMVGYTFGVHNGKNFTDVIIKEEMVGHRLGEFSLTRKFTRHGGKIQRELETAQAQSGAEKTKQAGASPAVGAKK